MSARVDAVAARVQTAVTTRQVTQSMGGVVKAMESAMRSMNLEQVNALKRARYYVRKIRLLLCIDRYSCEVMTVSLFGVDIAADGPL